uniref:Uroplakin 1A n=1 Tax=Sphenodon punctatus TaxID=8508 RepID=A0A8D0GL36_SPHPU
MAEKGSPFIVGLLVLGNIIILMSGLALYYKVYPILGVSGKDDVYAGAWISIFTGFSFFCLGVFGIIGLVSGNRLMVLLYLVLMLFVYMFECASCITSYTHRDFVKQVCSRVTRVHSLSSPLQQQYCGTSGPMDWVNYSSTFRTFYPEVVSPWPFLCCKRDPNFVILSQEGCPPVLTCLSLLQGCFDHIGHAVDSYTWGVSWFGFAILMFTCPVMLVAMYHYTTL